MFHQIITKYNKTNDETKTAVDLILNEMNDEVTYYLALCYESDITIESSLGKTEGDSILNLVMFKIIFFNKKYFDKWVGQNVTNKIIFIIEFLHLPYSNYVRNYTRDIFRLLLSESFCLPISNFVIIRNAIEESYEKNPIVYDDNVDLEKILEFSVFLSETFSTNSDKIEKYEKENPVFKSKYVSKIDNISGSLIGKAIGDSIGFLIEGHTADSCYEYVDKVISPKIVHLYGIDKDIGRTGNSRYCIIEGNEKIVVFPYGQYTIDTQCARELLLSIENGVLNIESFKKRMQSLYGLAGLISSEQNNISKTALIGTPESSFIENIKTGTPYKEEKNDPCARVAPLGAVYMSKKDVCKSATSAQASMSNSSETVIACSILIAEATRLALENKIKPYSRYNILNSPHIFCQQLSNSIMPINPTLGTYVLTMPFLIKTRKSLIKDSKLEYILASAFADRQIIKLITAECQKMFGEPLYNNGETISAAPVQSCLFSIFCFMCVPNFFVSSICMAVRSGGDVSSIAAIVGGIVGARVGLKSIPSYFIDRINDKGIYKSDELIHLCKNLCDPETTLIPNTFGIPEQTNTFTFGMPHQQTSTFGTQQTSTFGTQQTSTFGTPPTSSFGTQQTSTFGTQPTSSFGTQQTSTFGTPPTSSFGTPPTSSFGTQQTSTFGTPPQQTSSFGTPPQQTSSFGTPPTSTFGTPTTSSFGTQQTSSFGTPQQQTSTFGTPPTSSFGTPPQQTSTFGTQQTSSFGTQQTSSFGTQPTSSFGTPQKQTNSFGTPQKQTSTFGTPQTSSFGTQQTSTFGTPQTSSFGTPQTSSFGTPQTSSFGTPQTSTFATNKQPTSSFGTQPTSSFGTQQTSTFGTQPQTTFKPPSANPLTYSFGLK
jgi:ADP-ribosylglycohydrolase